MSDRPKRGSELNFFKAQIESATPGKILVVNVPAPRTPLETFLEQTQRNMGFVWYPRTGTAFAGFGVAARIDVSGPERMVQLRKGIDETWARLDVRTAEGLKASPPRMFGGMAFAPQGGGDGPWLAFGDGCFTLPRWCYSRQGEDVYLAFAIDVDKAAPDWQSIAVLEFDRLINILTGNMTPSTFHGPGLRSNLIPRSSVTRLPYERWHQLIDDIHGAIASGEFEKIVAARRSEITAQHPFNDVLILSRLATEYRDCFRFCYRRDDATFLGASPERLFFKRGSDLETQALAGTIVAGAIDDPTDPKQANRLLASEKDMIEHKIVVHEVVRRLTPLSESVTPTEKPQIRKVRNLLHLNTPITAKLREGAHPIEVLDALHPTPAVGGLPKEPAIPWITAHEPAPRGWYTGPIGWIDAAGDAEFVVAIRCGVIAGTRALIYAGAGIVKHSSAEQEYEETEIKQVPFLRALGVDA